MSQAIREIVRGYRAELSTRPDGAMHVMDARRITHAVLGEHPDRKTRCGIYVHNDADRPMFSNRGDAIPTWNDVNCITCLARREP